MNTEQQQGHNYKISDKDALEQLKILFEFTTPNNLRKSLQTTFFAFLEEEAEKGQSPRFKEIVQDYFFLFEFIDKLEEESPKS